MTQWPVTRDVEPLSADTRRALVDQVLPALPFNQREGLVAVLRELSDPSWTEGVLSQLVTALGAGPYTDPAFDTAMRTVFGLYTATYDVET
jgi:hypothetical protein